MKCKSYWLCGLGRYAMGFISALLGNAEALETVEAILDDEKNHRDVGFEEGGANNFLYYPLRFSISAFTEG